MLDFVLELYDHAMESDHRDFAAKFRMLSENARCLYVRLLNRKGRVFFRDYLKYEEIPSLDEAAAELMREGVLRVPADSEFADLLALKPKADLISLIR